jgi:hypothetical protein
LGVFESLLDLTVLTDADQFWLILGSLEERHNERFCGMGNPHGINQLSCKGEEML